MKSCGSFVIVVGGLVEFVICGCVTMVVGIQN